MSSNQVLVALFGGVFGFLALSSLVAGVLRWRLPAEIGRAHV